jgi:hypothetical protein
MPRLSQRSRWTAEAAPADAGPATRIGTLAVIRTFIGPFTDPFIRIFNTAS